jgi:hypothetical protein
MTTIAAAVGHQPIGPESQHVNGWQLLLTVIGMLLDIRYVEAFAGAALINQKIKRPDVAAALARRAQVQ